MRKLTSGVLVFYCAMLILQSAAPCFADEKMLEGKIVGTGPRKVWLLIGSNHGVTEGMVFEVFQGDAVVANIKVTKVGASSSEAEITGIANADVKVSPGDIVRWKLPPELEEKKKETTPTTTLPVTTPVTTETKKEELKPEPTTETKKEIAPSTTTTVETKKEEPATVTKPEIKKEETVAVTPTETKKEQTPKKTVKKKSGGIFGKKIWLYAVIAGAAAFALASGGSKSSGSSAPASAESVSSSSGSTPALPF